MTRTSPVRLRRQLRAAGYPDHEVTRLARAGALTAVRRGAYLVGAPPDDPAVRHRAQIRAAVAQLGTGAVVSHVSAAVLHGWTPWSIPLDQVRVTRARRGGGRSNGALHMRTAPLGPQELDLIEGIAVTSAARTVIDVARSEPFEQAVVLADQALASNAVDAAAVRAAFDRAAGWPGAPAAGRVVGFADGRSQSVGESRSRVALARAGLPTPTLQWTVRDERGRRIGDVDFGWPAARVVGEFDGMIKYGRLLRPGQSASDVVVAEKVREDALRAMDLQVVRWVWPDLDDFDPVAARLRQRLTR